VSNDDVKNEIDRAVCIAYSWLNFSSTLLHEFTLWA